MAASSAKPLAPDAAQALLQAAQAELHKIVVGQEDMVQRLFLGLLTNGHVLLEGVPGLAKTLTIRSLAQVLDLHFSRLQFTPDLLPADLIGSLVYNPKTQSFDTRKGPIFANLVLADEINRAPAKVQSALLEAMQERQVTLGEASHALPAPFLVLATQNPIEQEGTYPLPEAQVDRFLMKVSVGYPTKAEEKLILNRMATSAAQPTLSPKLKPAQLIAMRQAVNGITLSERLQAYIVELVHATRDPQAAGYASLADAVEFGASPRASIALGLLAKASAYWHGRDHVLPDDIKTLAPDVLNHRIRLRFEAEADGLTPRSVLAELLQSLPF